MEQFTFAYGATFSFDKGAILYEIWGQLKFKDKLDINLKKIQGFFK